MPDAKSPLSLGGISVPRFLARHWQRRARLVRDAIAGFTGPFDREGLQRLATRDDVESRIVVRTRGRYALEHGPFTRSRLRALPRTGWTLLVQGLNLHSDAADALLRRFDFVPFARLDDLMASFAVEGGGVGPHFDSYDVFLLQGFGRRRWRYGRQRDLSLVPGVPVKLLANFEPTQDAVLGPGDMLYLPPQIAHDGVAIEPCITYSIGFRAPSSQELATAFLDFLRDDVELEGRYADPGLEPSREPARIDARMHARIAATLAKIRWNDATVSRFIGSHLSEPKPGVWFDPPSRPMPLPAFARAIARSGVVLDRRSQLLYDARRFYLNGETLDVPRTASATLRTLANARRLSARQAAAAGDATLRVLHDAYRHGFLAPG